MTSRASRENGFRDYFSGVGPSAKTVPDNCDHCLLWNRFRGLQQLGSSAKTVPGSSLYILDCSSTEKLFEDFDEVL